MSKHYNGILELKLRLLEEPGEKTFVVPYVPLNVIEKTEETEDKRIR